MKIYKQLNEGCLVDIIAINPKIISRNDISVIKEYSVNGKRIDLLLTDRLNKDHYTIVEVKADAIGIRAGIGQVIEYKEKFLKSFTKDKNVIVDCVICAPCSAPFEFPPTIRYINLSENVEFLKGVIDILSSKLEMVCKALSSPIDLHIQFKKEELRMNEFETENIINILKRTNLKGQIKGDVVSLISKELEVGKNRAFYKLNEIERQGLVTFENVKTKEGGLGIKVCLTIAGEQYTILQ